MPIQFIHGRPTIAEALGQGAYAGIQQGLNQRIQEQQEQKKLDRQREQNALTNKMIFGSSEYGDADPAMALEMHKIKMAHGLTERHSAFQAALAGQSPQMEMEENIPQGNIAPGTDQELPFMAPYEERQAAPKNYSEPKTDITPKVEKKPLSEIDQMKQNRQKAIDIYNKEKDPVLKEKMYKDLNSASAQIRAAEKNEREKESLEESKRAGRYTREAPQREFLKTMDEEYNSTLKKRPIYKTMEKLGPKLTSTTALKKWTMDHFHIPAGVMLRPDEEVLGKVSEQLLRGIGTDFRGRILQSEVESYIRSNPSLLNSPEGLVKLAKISMSLDKVIEKKWKVANQIRKEARAIGEELPEDISSQVMEKSSDFYDQAFNDIERIAGEKFERPTDMITVIAPDGSEGEMPRERAEAAVVSGRGWRIK